LYNIFLEQLIVTQLIKKFPVIEAEDITVITKASYWMLSSV